METLWGKPPPVRVTTVRNDDLNEESLTRGVLVIGDPGSGKTQYVANQVYKSWKEHNEKAIFLFDWSGSLTNAILKRVSQDPHWEELLRKRKIVLDILGNSEYVIPKPEFHPSYGLTNEEQVNRVVGNMERLAKFLMAGAPFLAGVSIEEIGRELFRLITAITNEHGETWQITEAKRLLMDLALLKKATSTFGFREPAAKWYFEHEYLPRDVMKGTEKELTTRALRYILGKIEGREIRATLGYYKPGWTPKEATENGELVIIDGHELINQPEAQHYELMQNFSLVMSWINKREVDDPLYHPVMIGFDETYTVLQIQGMAEWLGMVSPLYRSRRIQLLIIIQALWQLNEQLAKQIWTLGNIVSFAVSNSDEAETIAKQLFVYDPKFVKHAPKTEYQNATTEPEAGQDRIIADWIQNLQARQFIMRRYETEQKKEKGVLFVPKTANTPITSSFIELTELKKILMKDRGVPIRDALEVINQRKLQEEKKESSPRKIE